ncbi:MAG: hypothetical protein QOI77_1999 [Blastocatellia bacterium]|nr:hypothetical protein [Blastocatellia bacterium]
MIRPSTRTLGGGIKLVCRGTCLTVREVSVAIWAVALPNVGLVARAVSLPHSRTYPRSTISRNPRTTASAPNSLGTLFPLEK